MYVLLENGVPGIPNLAHILVPAHDNQSDKAMLADTGETALHEAGNTFEAEANRGVAWQPLLDLV